MGISLVEYGSPYLDILPMAIDFRLRASLHTKSYTVHPSLSLKMDRNLRCCCLLFLWLGCCLYQSQALPLHRRDSTDRRKELYSRSESLTDTSPSATTLLRQQFEHPAETLGILLIIGGDIIQKAIAQLAGRRTAPVAFSFGWVSYSFGALLSVWGDGELLPRPDCASIVVNRKSGNTKRNESWVIGRLIRDLEMEYVTKDHYNSKAFRIIKLEAKDAWTQKLKDQEGQAVPDPPHHDIVWWSFLVCAVFQFGLAIAPMFIHRNRNWRILLVTAAGTMLALIHGSLPQWKKEKYHCRMTDAGKETTFILTRGNSHRYVFVIHVARDVRSLNLEDLAVRVGVGSSKSMKVGSAVLAILWIMLLVAIGGLAQDTWFLLGVGGFGMLHNVLVAGYKRGTSAHGVPLDTDKPYLINDEPGNVMDGLQAAERKEPGLGLALLKVFFPGRLRAHEEDFWQEAAENLAKQTEEKRKREEGGTQPQVKEPAEVVVTGGLEVAGGMRRTL